MLLHLARFEIHIQWRLVPKCEKLLIVSPPSTFWSELQVKVENDAGKYEAQLDESKTGQIKVRIVGLTIWKVTYKGSNNYFMPMQFLGPYEKGWKTSLLSLSKRGSLTQRSGMNESG